MSQATKYTLKPALQANFTGIIWKVETDPAGSTIAIETRDPQNRSASFSAFDFKTGATLFKEVSVEDSWHWGLDLACHGFVYLHSYINEKTPEHKAIIALDHTGKIAWQIFNKALENSNDAGLIAYNPSIQQKQFELLDPATGQVTQRNVQHFSPARREIYFPEPTTEPLILGQLEAVGDIVGPVSYLAHHDKNCFSFHVAKGPSFSQLLLIKSKGKTIHEEILEDNIQKLNPEPFYIEQNHLFCVRSNKAEIVAYLV